MWVFLAFFVGRGVCLSQRVQHVGTESAYTVTPVGNLCSCPNLLSLAGASQAL